MAKKASKKVVKKVSKKPAKKAATKRPPKSFTPVKEKPPVQEEVVDTTETPHEDVPPEDQGLSGDSLNDLDEA